MQDLLDATPKLHPGLTMSGFTLIAHRGLSAKAPENTFAAFDLALNCGFLQIETDCLLSTDGICMVLHDEQLGRTNNGSGKASDYSCRDLQALDAGSWFSSHFKDCRIPTLQEFLLRYHGRVHLHLELKSTQPELPQQVFHLLNSCGWLEKGHQCAMETATSDVFSVPGLTITSFHLEQLIKSRQLMPTVRHGWLVQAIDDAALASCKQHGLQQICPRADICDAAAVRAAQEAGLSVRGWGVKNMQLLHHIVGCGVSGATVDWPDDARAELQGNTGAASEQPRAAPAVC